MSTMTSHNTRYVSNIDWKVKKPLLKRALYVLITRDGKVLEVVALRKDGLRGQAFVIFEEAASASEALQKENGLVLFGKPLKIEFSNESVCTKCQNLGFFSSLQKGDGTHCQ